MSEHTVDESRLIANSAQWLETRARYAIDSARYRCATAVRANAIRQCASGYTQPSMQERRGPRKGHACIQNRQATAHSMCLVQARHTPRLSCEKYLYVLVGYCNSSHGRTQPHSCRVGPDLSIQPPSPGPKPRATAYRTYRQYRACSRRPPPTSA